LWRVAYSTSRRAVCTKYGRPFRNVRSPIYCRAIKHRRHKDASIMSHEYGVCSRFEIIRYSTCSSGHDAECDACQVMFLLGLRGTLTRFKWRCILLRNALCYSDDERRWCRKICDLACHRAIPNFTKSAKPMSSVAPIYRL
jgi:hypothetical protein